MSHEPLVLIRELWKPILLAVVLCYLSGVAMYMLLPFHKKDWAGMPGEDGILDAMRRAGLGAGQFMFPFCSDMKMRNDPAFMKKFESGPAGIMVVRKPGPFSMAPKMAQMILYHLVVTCFVAYLATRTLSFGADYLHVFRIAGTGAVMAYAFGAIPQTIWYDFKWGFTIRHVFDGVLSGLLTAGAFGWLWPR